MGLDNSCSIVLLFEFCEFSSLQQTSHIGSYGCCSSVLFHQLGSQYTSSIGNINVLMMELVSGFSINYSVDRPVSSVNTLNADGSLHFDGTYRHSTSFSQNLHTLFMVVQRCIIHCCIAAKIYKDNIHRVMSRSEQYSYYLSSE